MSIFESSLAAENAISDREHQRAVALEAILHVDSVMKAMEGKMNVESKIERLENRFPIKITPEKPGSIDEFSKLFKRLTVMDLGKNATTKAELRLVFDQLTKIYALEEAYHQVPLTVSELKAVSEELSLTDGKHQHAFKNQ